MKKLLFAPVETCNETFARISEWDICCRKKLGPDHNKCNEFITLARTPRDIKLLDFGPLEYVS